jgi:ribosome maturation factor RimP
LKVETVKNGQDGVKIPDVQAVAARTAEQLGFELVEVTLQKEADGLALCVYIDREGGITLDDCERFHKAIQPLLDAVTYDYLEVSSPGADRPIKTQRDAEKHHGDRVEVRLFAKLDGAKLFMGSLDGMDDENVAIVTADGRRLVFPHKAVALVKPVVEIAADAE